MESLREVTKHQRQDKHLAMKKVPQHGAAGDLRGKTFAEPLPIFVASAVISVRQLVGTTISVPNGMHLFYVPNSILFECLCNEHDVLIGGHALVKAKALEYAATQYDRVRVNMGVSQI